MVTEDDETALRARVQRSVGGLPGPDRARLAAIEGRLPLASGGRRRWLPLLLGAGVAGAAAAGWYAIAPPGDPDRSAVQERPGDRPDAEVRKGAAEESGDAGGSEKAGADRGSGDGAVIYQR